MGTERSGFKKFDTVVFHYNLLPARFSNRFEKEWKGYGANTVRWSRYDEGSQKIFNKMPAGTYLLKIRPDWLTKNR